VLKVILSLESGRKTQKQQPAQTTSQPAVEAKPTASNLHTSFPNNQGPQATKLNMALTIIAEESGLAVSDLSDTTVFSEVGIDSLLGLTISTRFREELDLDLEFNAMFFDYPTVGDLKLFFGDAELSGTPISSSSASYDDTASPTSTAGATTPSNGEGAGCELDFQSVLAIISEESGISMEELAEDTNFADSGVDSLLSLVIVSRLRDELEFDIQHESLLLECPTVGDLRRLLLGDVLSGNPVKFDLPIEPEVPEGTKTQGGASTTVDETPVRTEKEILALDTRKQAVDELVQKYTASFAVSGPSQKSITASENETVVLVTGASGSLGSHLVYHFAQLPDVKRVVCLNRENKVDPYLRQRMAMRDKGIRFPEALKNKLLVLQTDITKPMLGLPSDVYKSLTTSVTHLIHNAWPMSAKRDLAGFEPQFQSMRNLIDFGCHVISCRSSSFKFSFQMVSSIGVVGHYGLGTGETRTMVPEDRMSIDAVLPNGYGEAKWGCERMIDETLHKHASHFRSMVVRLGQIAGSKTSGYWNPMEHFGFLLKSSQTLNALPDVDGDVFWTPVNDIAEILSDLILSDRTPHHIYHIENPVGQTWKEINAILSNALNIPNLIPFTEWLERVRAAPHRKNPAATLLEFLESNYLRMSCGGLILDTHHTLQHSKTLSAIGPVSEEVVRKYIHIWKEIGFLD
jgi:thioester reductase-like protein/acyl carrier protein